MTPPAAVAVLAAAIEDAQRDGRTDPASVAQRAASALDAHGWTVSAQERTNSPETAAQRFITTP